MAKSPSNIALKVTNFFLQLNYWRLSVGGKVLITAVNTAATAQTTVTDTQYNNYTMYTAERWSVYVQHNALTS
jgi:hypothetical protein